MGKMAEKAAKKRRLKESVKKLDSLQQHELDYVVSHYLENLLKMPLKHRIEFSMRLLTKNFDIGDKWLWIFIFTGSGIILLLQWVLAYMVYG